MSAAGIGRIDHRVKVQRVVFVGSADLDLANELITLVGAASYGVRDGT